eukprot:TRINITY_DN4120_c0_g1_i3.p1 TRINITY_DN4120_c0_g1~~TRINITY_DN4120_c0_g1_i3.p1  ORF type:complete len:215 (+),score=66.17 TRINITY_DN4120_c0_g1_i3:150-794(+)
MLRSLVGSEMCIRDRLWMGQNSLSGTVPAELSSLTVLEGLYLGQNSLSGTVPGQLLRLSSSLFSLDLSKNLLSGTIPAGLLAPEISLEDNQLSGTVPQQLCSATAECDLESNLGLACPDSDCQQHCQLNSTCAAPAMLLDAVDFSAESKEGGSDGGVNVLIVCLVVGAAVAVAALLGLAVQRMRSSSPRPEEQVPFPKAPGMPMYESVSSLEQL